MNTEAAPSLPPDSPPPARKARKRKKKCPFPLVEVTWWDSYRDMSKTWYSVDKLSEERCPELTHVGYIIHKDENRIVLASGVDLDDHTQAEGKFIIPLGCIRSVKEL